MSTKTATVRQTQGLSFIARSDSNHWVLMDTAKESGGHDGAATPKELLLVALGGCTAMDVAGILTKKRVAYDHMEIRLTATVQDEHPKVFTEIHVEYVVRGEGIDPVDVERAIELSTTKYCSVSAMLRPAVRLTHSYIIEPSAPDAARTDHPAVMVPSTSH